MRRRGRTDQRPALTSWCFSLCLRVSRYVVSTNSPVPEISPPHRGVVSLAGSPTRPPPIGLGRRALLFALSEHMPIRPWLTCLPTSSSARAKRASSPAVNPRRTRGQWLPDPRIRLPDGPPSPLALSGPASLDAAQRLCRDMTQAWRSAPTAHRMLLPAPDRIPSSGLPFGDLVFVHTCRVSVGQGTSYSVAFIASSSTVA